MMALVPYSENLANLSKIFRVQSEYFDCGRTALEYARGTRWVEKKSLEYREKSAMIMDDIGKEQQYFLSFDSVQEFDKAFERKGPETGIFFRSKREISPGELVSIVISIKGTSTPVFLKGRVLWRRHRAGGAHLPSGVFVGLVDRDRARLDAIIKHIKAIGRRERRIVPRYPIRIRGNYATSQGNFDCYTQDLSWNGAFLHCHGPLLSVGAKFPLEMFLGGEKHKSIVLEAQVAWIDPFEETKGMGVLFVPGQSPTKKLHKIVDDYEKQIKRHKEDE